MFRRRIKLHPLEKLREALWPRRGWSRMLQYGWKRVWRLADTPNAIALGLAAGTYASFTPFIGFHFVLAFFIAWILRGNLIAAAFGTLVGNPLTFPLIWIATYDLGSWLLGESGARAADPGNLSMDFFLNQALDAILPLATPMLMGSIPVGVPAAAGVYFVSRGAVGTYQARRRLALSRKQERFGGRSGLSGFNRPVAGNRLLGKEHDAKGASGQ